jgi:very-short-patch-repair endonuclease
MGNETLRIQGKRQTALRVDAQIARLAAGQLGLVATWQLLNLDIGEGAIEYRVRQKRLHRVHRGVYLVGHSVLPFNARELAAVLACGPDAVASHHSAAGLWALVKRSAQVDVRVTVPGRKLRSRTGIKVSFASFLDERDRRMLGPVPVTAPARTIIDMAATLEADRLEPLIADAQGRRLLTTQELHEAMNRAPHATGIAALRSMTAAPKLTRREGERRLLKLIRHHKLPEPLCNTPVGPYLVDVLWPEHKLIAEFDSREWHGHDILGRFEADRVRDGILLAMGYVTKRVTWKELTQTPDTLAALLRTLLEQRAPRSTAPPAALA